MINLRLFRVLAVLFFSFIGYSLIVSFFSGNIVLHSANPPQGYTGATGSYCTSCHLGNPLNKPGGSVSVIGLPSGSYAPGQKYNFSITISHSVADRKRWGFSIIAVTNSGQSVGTFGSTNANAKINGSELSHFNAVTTTSQSSYNYGSLSWTAPVLPTADQQTVNFYFVGNAADASLDNSGDFIYASTQQAKLTSIFTFTGNGNWNVSANWSGGNIPPTTISGSSEILISPVANGECILNLPLTVSQGAKFTVAPGAKFTLTTSGIQN